MVQISENLKQFLGDDGERVIYATRQHPIVIVGTILTMVLTVVGAGVVIWLMGMPEFLEGDPKKWGTIAVGVIAGLLLIREAWSLLTWQFERLMVSTHKVMHVHGVLSRDVSSTPLVKVDELTVRQSLLGRLMNYGHLDVENASGGREPLHGLRSIPNPGHVYQLITDSARRERLIEGGAHREYLEPVGNADAPTPEQVAASEKRRSDVGSTGDE